jgi:hypothetical protein
MRFPLPALTDRPLAQLILALLVCLPLLGMHPAVGAEPMSEQRALHVHMVDADGQPVAGAVIGTRAVHSAESGLAITGLDAADRPRSDEAGRVVLQEQWVFHRPWMLERGQPLFAWHEERNLAGLIIVSEKDLARPVEITMAPATRLHGELTVADLDGRDHPPRWSNVVAMRR